MARATTIDKRQVIARDVAQGFDQLLPIPETAERMTTTVTHVRDLIRTGRLTHVRVGRFIRVPSSAVAEFIAASLEVGR